MVMPRAFSSYLDLLRLSAALLVFFGHFGQPRFAGVATALGQVGHSAVIVFFLLSGYLISAVAQEKEHHLVEFIASRAARIYSVVLPALALTAAVDLMLIAHGATDIPVYQLTQPWKYLPLFLGFGTDLWFLHEDAFSNLPFWSLSYEVWYYALFAGLIYLRGWPRRLLIGAILLLVGPRLWLLLPIWALGGGVYHWHRQRRLGLAVARSVFVLSLLGVVLLKASGIEDAVNHWSQTLIGPEGSAALRYSRFFLGDSLFALLVALNLLAARDCGLGFGRTGRVISYLAGFTFTLYLVHYPLLELVAALLAPGPVLLAGLVLVAAWAIGLTTERQKPRLRALILRLIDRRRGASANHQSAASVG